VLSVESKLLLCFLFNPAHEATYSSGTSVDLQRTTRNYIPEARILPIRARESEIRHVDICSTPYEEMWTGNNAPVKLTHKVFS
jgi:hypothetical protein